VRDGSLGSGPLGPRTRFLLACLPAVAIAVAVLGAPAPASAQSVKVEPNLPPPGAVPGPGGWTLVTGDSMMYVAEKQMQRELGAWGASVHADTRVGSGITKPFLMDWLYYARRQAELVAPTATVVFLGAGDVYDIRVGRRTVRWGTRAWREAYARRVYAMVRSYLRGGRGRVYWLTLPVPRDRRLAAVFRTIDAAIARAVRRAGPRARVVDLRPVFTPRRRYRHRMRVDGELRVVRQADGVHLSPVGARVAARIVRAEMQRDGLLPAAPPPAAG